MSLIDTPDNRSVVHGSDDTKSNTRESDSIGFGMKPALSSDAKIPENTVLGDGLQSQGSKGAYHHKIPLGVRSTKVNLQYARIVQLLKVLLPTTALLLIALLVLWPSVSEQVTGLIPTLLDDSAVDSMQVANARYQGIDDQNQPYVVTADRITRRDVTSTDVYLSGPKADIILTDDSWAAITAREGVFDQKKQILILDGDVSFFHDLGYEFKTDTVVIDMRAGIARSNTTIRGQGPFGQVQADGFRIFDKGARVVLTGNAKVMINADVF